MAPNGPLPDLGAEHGQGREDQRVDGADRGGEPVADPGRGHHHQVGDRQRLVGAEAARAAPSIEAAATQTSSSRQCGRASGTRTRVPSRVRACARKSAVSRPSTAATTTKVLQALRTTQPRSSSQVTVPDRQVHGHQAGYGAGERRRHAGDRRAREVARVRDPPREPAPEGPVLDERAEGADRDADEQVRDAEQHGRHRVDAEQRRRPPRCRQEQGAVEQHLPAGASAEHPERGDAGRRPEEDQPAAVRDGQPSEHQGNHVDRQVRRGSPPAPAGHADQSASESRQLHPYRQLSCARA